MRKTEPEPASADPQRPPQRDQTP